MKENGTASGGGERGDGAAKPAGGKAKGKYRKDGNDTDADTWRSGRCEVAQSPEEYTSKSHTEAELELQGALSGGMRPKVAAIRVALKGGVPRVHVVDGRISGTLLDEVFTTEGAGTLVVPRREAAS